MRKKEKKLGTSGDKRRYDLPLDKGNGIDFLMLLIGLMTFLLMMAIVSSFILSAMTKRWSSGLENMVTIEIPAENSDGTLLKPDEIKARAHKIANMLISNPVVLSANVLGDEKIKELVEPWIGDNTLMLDIPLPGLISVELKEATPRITGLLEKRIKDIAPNARLDTHKEWLESLLNFTGSLQFAASMLVLIIGCTTITAVAGAVKSRMAEHHVEVELLHLIGATDNYISGQLQRYSMLLALKGGVLGAILGTLTIIVINLISGKMYINLIPEFTFSNLQILILLTLPALVALIASITARRTVLRVLAQML